MVGAEGTMKNSHRGHAVFLSSWSSQLTEETNTQIEVRSQVGLTLRIVNWGLGEGVHTGTAFLLLVLAGLPSFPFPTHTHTQWPLTGTPALGMEAEQKLAIGKTSLTLLPGARVETPVKTFAGWAPSWALSRSPSASPLIWFSWSLFCKHTLCASLPKLCSHKVPVWKAPPLHCLLSISITYSPFKLRQVVNLKKVPKRGLSFSAGMFVVDTTHFTLILSGMSSFSCVRTIQIALAHSQQTFPWRRRGSRGKQVPLLSAWQWPH